MKKCTLLLIPFICIVVYAGAQENDQVWFHNKKGEQVKEKKAEYLQQIRKMNDTLWENNTYEVHGPVIRTFYSKDAMGQIRNGGYYAKNPDGGDTTGYYTNNERDKEWIVRPAGYGSKKVLVYAKGLLTGEHDSSVANRENASSKMTDTAAFSRGVTKVEIESEFRGGLRAWAAYLGKNLHYPDRAVNNRVQGTVIVLFIVTDKGKVKDATVIKSVEYSLDQEALRMIEHSPDWIPAVQNGVPVKSYKKQPIVFKLEVR